MKMNYAACNFGEWQSGIFRTGYHFDEKTELEICCVYSAIKSIEEMEKGFKDIELKASALNLCHSDIKTSNVAGNDYFAICFRTASISTKDRTVCIFPCAIL